jgi:hypothetical protein
MVCAVFSNAENSYGVQLFQPRQTTKLVYTPCLYCAFHCVYYEQRAVPGHHLLSQPEYAPQCAEMDTHKMAEITAILLLLLLSSTLSPL